MDLCAKLSASFDGDPAAEQLSPLLHPKEAEAAAARGTLPRRGHVKSHPVVLDDQLQLFAPTSQTHVHSLRPSMTYHVGQRFLYNPEALGLDLGRHAELWRVGREPSLESSAPGYADQVPSNRSYQS